MRASVSRSSLRAGVLTLVALLLLALASSAARAASLTNAKLAGFQGDVSCLSSKLCVAVGYDTHGVGDVVAVRGGVAGHVSSVAKTQSFYSVSCPSASGCLALGVASTGAGVVLATVNRSGAVSAVRRPSVPAGVSLGRIACVSLTSCVLAGNDVFLSPDPVVIGAWNGRTLTLRHVAPPAGSTDTVVERVGCFAVACDVVGYANKGATNVGFVVTTSRGRPTGLHVAPGDSLCGSPARARRSVTPTASTPAAGSSSP